MPSKMNISVVAASVSDGNRFRCTKIDKTVHPDLLLMGSDVRLCLTLLIANRR
jgi:hypothetical protein